MSITSPDIMDTTFTAAMDLSNPPTALTQFTFFPLLPTELRLLIWRACLSPRAVTLTSLTLPLSSPTPPPITLSVSRESRSESLRFYITLGPGIYFHPSLDTLYIPRSTGGFLGYADQARDFGTLPIPGLSKIQKVAVDYVLPEIRREWEAYSKFCLVRGFKGLREGGLVIGTERERLPVGETQDGGHQQQQQSQMELREPRGDREGVRRIMEIVRESFRVEGVGEDGKRWEVEEGLARDEWGKFEIDTGLELRPLVRVVRV